MNRNRWFDPKRAAGGWAFMLHRLTGLALVFYLLLHLAVLNLLRAGPEAWDKFMRLARTPAFLFLDTVLLWGVLFHGLNGLRLGLLGAGRGLRHERQMFWFAFGAATMLCAGFALIVLGK